MKTEFLIQESADNGATWYPVGYTKDPTTDIEKRKAESTHMVRYSTLD